MKLNFFTYGVNNSHCGGCAEHSDYKWFGVLTTLSEDEVLEVAKKYVEKKKKWKPIGFLNLLACKNYEFNTPGGVYMEEIGDSCAPNIDGEWAGEQYEIDEWNEKDLFSPEGLKEAQRIREAEYAQELKKEKARREKEDRERDERTLAQLAKKLGKTIS